MTFSRFFVLFFLFFLGTVLGPGNVFADASVSGKPLEKVRLQLKWLHQFQFAGFYAAIERGYYREVGLDVELLEASAHESAVDVVLRGEAEFGVHGSDLVVARGHGKPVVALAALFQHSPMVLLARKDRGIDSLHDLVGKRLQLGPDAAELQAYLKSERVPIEVNLSQQSFDLKALMAGEVDAMPAYSTDEPFLLDRAGMPYHQFTPRSAGFDFYGDTLFTTEAVLKADRDRVERFLQASLRGWYYALSHREELVDLIQGRYGYRHSREHLLFEAEQVRRLIMPELIEIGHMSPGRWRHIADSYANLGMMPAGFDLGGFLYETNPRTDLTPYYWGLVGLFLAAGLAFVISLYYRSLSRKLNQEMQERQAAEAGLRESEQRYRRLVEAAPFPVVISRVRDGVIRYVNPRTLQQFNVRSEDIVGRDVRQFYLDPAQRDALAAKLQLGEQVVDREVQLRDLHGRSFWAMTSSTLIDYEHTPAVFTAVNDISEMKRLQSRLEELANTDVLTGLANRRHFMQALEHEMERARRKQAPLTLLALDIDHFKQVNDSYGHAAGDQVLQAFADALRALLRGYDFAGRFGGEEFMVVLPETDEAAAVPVAERIREVVEQTLVLHEDRSIGITVSIGVASLAHQESLDHLIRRADQMLYAAKQQGRNRVVHRLPEVPHEEPL